MVVGILYRIVVNGFWLGQSDDTPHPLFGLIRQRHK